jgi:hypothetical protein
MRHGVAPLALCVALALCAGAAAQHTLTLDCCTVLNKLYAYMKVTDGYKCTGPDTGCASVKLVHQFITYTKAATHGSDMHAQGSDIVLSIPSNRDLEDLFVFSFFGRTASPAESTGVDLWLSYDKTHERIVFEDSTCDYNRNVYTLLERFSRLGNSLHGRDDAPMPDGAIPWVAVSPGKLYRRAQEQL